MRATLRVEFTRHERRIASRPTASSPHDAPAAEAETALRAELLSQIANVEADLEAAARQLARDGDNAGLAQNQNQRLELAQLLRSVATSGPDKLAAMQTQIAAVLAASAATASDARTGTSRASEAAELAAASANSRQQVQSLLRDLHRFDPYLSFGSPEEEADYRRRQTGRSGFIEQQLTRGTPEGDLNANAAALGQLVDAEAHGAGNSPGFDATWDNSATAYTRLQTDIRRAGGSTRVADEMLARDVRQSLRGRGRSDQEIDAMFAALGGDPLAVAEAARETPMQARRSEARPPAPGAVPTQQDELADAMAALRAAGVTAAPEISGTEPTASLPQVQSRAPAIGRA